MVDNKHLGGGLDKKLIDLHEPYEVRYWTSLFGISEAELKSAVRTVGFQAVDVRRYVSNRGTVTFTKRNENSGTIARVVRVQPNKKDDVDPFKEKAEKILAAAVKHARSTKLRPATAADLRSFFKRSKD